MKAMSVRPGLNAKLTLCALVSILLSLLVAGVAYILYDRHGYRQLHLEELHGLAGVISERVSTGVPLGDTDLAADHLLMLKSRRDIAGACVMGRDAAILAIYRREPYMPICQRLRHADAVEVMDGHILVVEQVLVNGEPLGEIHILGTLTGLGERLNRIVGFMLLVALGAVLIVLQVSRRLQHWVTRPILELSGKACTVARDKDYAVRADKLSDDELGALVDAFNGMLETIEMQNRRLMDSHQRLEGLIAQRTMELEQAQASLLRQERLATLGQLTGTVSHELRNPLGTIQTSVEVLRRALPDSRGEVDRALQRIERNIHRCEGIINELLDYSRGSPPQLQRVQVDAWLRDVLAGYAHPLRIALERIDAVSAEFDPERLRRAMINVLDNAWQACGERGVAGGDAPCVRIAVRAVDARLQIDIADNGVGMEPDVLARVFEPLFSTRAFGVGLGLAIVRQILEQHGGGVAIDSVAGQGTCVRLWLPWHEESGHAGAAT